MSAPVCPCCGGSSFLSSKAYPYPEGTKPDLPDLPKEIRICSKCGSGSSHPPISEESLVKYYRAEKSHWGDLSKMRGPRDIPVNIALARSRWRYIAKYAGAPLKNLRVLDIGAGNGAFGLSAAHDSSLSFYTAQDYDLQILARLREIWPAGAPAKLEAAETVTNEALARADLLVLSHVIEHLQSPSSYLKEKISNMKKGSLIFIEVPHLDFRFKPVLFPHLVFFSKNGLVTLAEQLGLECLHAGVFGGDIETAYMTSPHKGPKRFFERGVLFSRNTLPEPVLYRALSAIYGADTTGEDGPWLRLLAHVR